MLIPAETIQVTLVPRWAYLDRKTKKMTAHHPKTWPKHEDAQLGPVVSLADALAGTFRAEPVDPHGHHNGECFIMQCAPMAVEGKAAPRLATTAWQHEGGVKMVLLCTDIDAAKKGEAWFKALQWWGQNQPAIAAFREAHPGAFVACSRGGLRIYQVLETPFVITNEELADEWLRRYEAWCTYVATQFPWVDAKVDSACKDWSRLQRIPHDTRDGIPQDLPTLGEPELVGSVVLPDPAPPKAYRAPLKPWAGPYERPDSVRGWVLRKVADVLPKHGEGVHEAAMALGGILAASAWDTEFVAAFVALCFRTAGIEREDIERTAAESCERARGGRPAYGWPRFKSLCTGTADNIEAACKALEAHAPQLDRYAWFDAISSKKGK